MRTSIGALSAVAFTYGMARADTVNYGNITLSGGYQAGHFEQLWDLTKCDLVLSFTVDLNGILDNDPGPPDGWSYGDHAWAELGIREMGAVNFNPNNKGVWLATDYDEAWPEAVRNTFAPDPPGAPTLDMDDKLILQKQGGVGEGGYNLPGTPPAPGNNHRIWFDRDGVDQWQAQSPLAVNGGTYNTLGLYHVEIRLHATDATHGTAYMKIKGLDQGFETDGNWNTMELTPAGMTFTGDMTKMQVFYGLYGYGATHSVTFQNITAAQGYGISYTGGNLFAAGENNVSLSAQVTSFIGDGSGIPVLFTIDGGAPIPATTIAGGTASATVTLPAGVYAVTVTVACLGSDTQFLAVYDPTAGFVTGGGWIWSPVGALEIDPVLEGKATFGFVSKYQKGATVPTVPTGNTEFQFKAGDLNFKSTSYDWLVIAGARAQYKGVGTINGGGEYRFMLTAIDGQVNGGGGTDKFRIKIWDKATDTLIYDNQLGAGDTEAPTTALGGGSIVIHK